MKTLKLFTSLCILNFACCIYSNAQDNTSNKVQTIRPSAIVQIPKVDLNNMAIMREAANEKEENKFTEEFRREHHATSDVAVAPKNNSGGNTYQARINPCAPPPIVQTN